MVAMDIAHMGVGIAEGTLVLGLNLDGILKSIGRAGERLIG